MNRMRAQTGVLCCAIAALLYQKNDSLHILHAVWIVYPLLPFEILVSSLGLLVKFSHIVLGGL